MKRLPPCPWRARRWRNERNRRMSLPEVFSRSMKSLVRLITGRDRYRPELHYMRGKPSGHAPAGKQRRAGSSGRRGQAE